MTNNSTTSPVLRSNPVPPSTIRNRGLTSPRLQSAAETAVDLLDDWFDPIEAGLRDRVREFIQTMMLVMV